LPLETALTKYVFNKRLQFAAQVVHYFTLYKYTEMEKQLCSFLEPKLSSKEKTWCHQKRKGQDNNSIPLISSLCHNVNEHSFVK
jgi:hypothetical protein